MGIGMLSQYMPTTLDFNLDHSSWCSAEYDPFINATHCCYHSYILQVLINYNKKFYNSKAKYMKITENEIFSERND